MSISSIPGPMRLGPYELLRRIATGGMAEVYLARRAGPHGFQKIVAVKRILPQFSKDADFVAMFVDEARVSARLGHPNIVQVFDFGDHDDELYMAMEYVDGTTGARLIRAAASRGEEVPLDVTLHITLSILRALEYAHDARDDDSKLLRLVHRDVSPGNVLIDRSGAVKLTDFGIARAAEIERRTDAGQLKGKLGYMSPEQVTGRELDARSDLFTLAILFAELLILRPLFSGGRELDVLLRIRDADLTAIDRSSHRVPEDIRGVLFRALARDPEQRFPTASAFAEAIEEVVRRRRLQVGPSRLAAFIEKLGLVHGMDVEEETGEETLASVVDGDTTTRRIVRESENPPTPATGRPSTPPSEPRDVAPQIYRVKLADGTIRGPLSYPRLVELFATGGAGRSNEVAREHGKFKPAVEFQELARFVNSPAMQWEIDLPLDAIDRGKIDRARLPTRLFHLAVRRDTGALVLRDGAKRKKIFFVAGSPEFVASTDKHELLGEYLIARGQVLRMEVDMALAMLPRFGGRLGDALVGLGVLRPIELFRAIHDQIQERFIEVFTWGGGEIGFARGARSHEETFPLGVDPYELIARGVRHGYSYEELQATLQPILEEVIEPVLMPPVRIELFRLPERDAFVLDSIEGKTTIARVMASLTSKGEADPEEVLRAVFLGLCCELVRSPKWVIPPSIPTKRGSGAHKRE
jgi:eukaryotic-like serine/threonine-protein kinase